MSYSRRDSSANIQTTFNPPLYLQTNRNYELAMVNLETYYSFANIREGDNNSFKWNADDGKTSTILHVPTECYELQAINAAIIRIRGNSDIAILPKANPLQCILTVVGAKCKGSFDVPNSLASVLVFERSIYGVGRLASDDLVNFTPFRYIAISFILRTCVVHKLQLPTIAALVEKTLVAPIDRLCYGQHYTQMKVVEAKVGLRQQYNELILFQGQ